MICKGNPHLIEYNVRMGDPECQVILPRIKTDLIDIVNASIENKLKSLKISWSKTLEKNLCQYFINIFRYLNNFIKKLFLLY